MVAIKFGTDGWRAIIAKEYTTDNVARVAKATAQWIQDGEGPNRVVMGHDCRFGGAMFQEVTAKVMASQGIKVYIDKMSAPYLQGSEIDFVQNDMMGAGFAIKNPNVKSSCGCGQSHRF